MSTPSDSVENGQHVENSPRPVTTTKFRLSASDILLTYPHCDAAKEELELHLRNVFKDFAKAAICTELHSDGTPHLHAIVHLTKRCNLHSSRTLDFHDRRGRIFHGNYQPARSATGSLNYVEKGGDVLYCGGTMEDVRGVFQNRVAPKEAGKKRINECFNRLLDGKSVASILLDENLQACMIMHRKNLEAAFAEVNAERALQKQLRFVTASGPPGSPSAAIAEWLNRNLNCVRTFGAPQLFLHGPTGIGKTHLLKCLEPALRIYYLNMMEDWMDGYDDDKYDMIVIEEFFSQKTLQFMNQLLDGQPMPLRIRNGCNGKLKRKNIPIIITSNFSLHEIFTKVDQSRKATFDRRVQPVYSPDRIDVTLVLEPVQVPSLLSTEVLEPSLPPSSPEAQALGGTGNISSSPPVPTGLYEQFRDSHEDRFKWRPRRSQAREIVIQEDGDE